MPTSRFTMVGLNNVLKRLDMHKMKITKAVQDIYEESAKNIEQEAKRIVRVDTGRLQASIQAKVTNKNKAMISILVGSDVFYAIYVERRYPYLFPSMEREKPILMHKLRNLVAGASSYDSQSNYMSD